MKQKYRVLGLMSGTSLDAIDIALIETDGQTTSTFIAGESFLYDPMFRNQVRERCGKKADRADPNTIWLETELTKRHAVAVQAFLSKKGIDKASVDLIGFHGQTIWHNPKQKETIQLGDGRLLADMTGIDVVNDFRSADVAAGGQGAPLVPLYHQLLVSGLPKPVAIVNIGGVANLTWIGSDDESDILSFDTGPGNAMIDDWVLEYTGKKYDEGGALAAQGTIAQSYIELFLHHPYFQIKPPKSLDRNAFMNFRPKGISDADGAATLTMMTARSIADALLSLPTEPTRIYVAGGGRHNTTLMSWISEISHLPISSVDDLGWRGDYLEAEAFAYLAVRSVLGLPLSLPTTTGVDQPTTGGVLHEA